MLGVDIKTGQVLIFDETMSYQERVELIKSSAAIPFAFPPLEKDNMMLIDGSLYTDLTIGDPIQRCRDEVEDDSDIIIDVILCFGTPVGFDSWNLAETRWYTALDFYHRREEIHNYHRHEAEILRMMRGYPDVNFRLIIEPEEKLTEKGAIPIYASVEDLE